MTTVMLAVAIFTTFVTTNCNRGDDGRDIGDDGRDSFDVSRDADDYIVIYISMTFDSLYNYGKTREGDYDISSDDNFSRDEATL